MVRIQFISEQDEVQGFYLLATNTRARGHPEGMYEIAQSSLALLDQHSIKYRVIPPSETAPNEVDAIRNPLTLEL